MIDRDHGLSLSRQAEALGISRGAIYYRAQATSADDLALMRRIDELHLDHPFAGSRMLKGLLNAEGHEVGRLHVSTLMKRMGVEAIYRRPRTSAPTPGHKVYPYLLRNVGVTRPNQVWAMDITYVPMARGFVYLAAVVDWFSRRVLAWRLSITLTADFCIEALEEALGRHGRPDIFNTDQGSQFTSTDFTKVLKDARVAISMDGRGAWRDNVFVERLWRDGEVRGGLPARLRERLRGAVLDRALLRLLQRHEAAFVARRADARPGLLQPADANPGGGVTRAESHSAAARKLLRQAEPPLTSVRSTVVACSGEVRLVTVAETVTIAFFQAPPPLPKNIYVDPGEAFGQSLFEPTGVLLAEDVGRDPSARFLCNISTFKIVHVVLGDPRLERKLCEYRTRTRGESQLTALVARLGPEIEYIAWDDTSSG